MRVGEARECGFAPSFENALKTARGDFIFLSNQEDVGPEGKADKMLRASKTNDLAISDCITVNGNLEIPQQPYFEAFHIRSGFLRHFIKSKCTGCYMAFKRSIWAASLTFSCIENLIEYASDGGFTRGRSRCWSSFRKERMGSSGLRADFLNRLNASKKSDASKNGSQIQKEQQDLAQAPATPTKSSFAGRVGEIVSVAMTSYNGGKYIARQIESILMNLKDDDELIISDDGSTDDTISIINSFKDSRIKLVAGPRKGVNVNFDNAIAHCKGDYIFLCDQDDIWHPDKVQRVLREFKRSNCVLVAHDAVITDGKGKVLFPSYFEHRNCGSGRIKNFVRNTYVGCCMAFSADIKNYIRPIPSGLFFHDQWIGLRAEGKGKCVFLNEKLMEYRRAEDNLSSFTPNSLAIQIKSRCQLAVALLKRFLTNSTKT